MSQQIARPIRDARTHRPKAKAPPSRIIGTWRRNGEGKKNGRKNQIYVKFCHLWPALAFAARAPWMKIFSFSSGRTYFEIWLVNRTERRTGIYKHPSVNHDTNVTTIYLLFSSVCFHYTCALGSSTPSMLVSIVRSIQCVHCVPQPIAFDFYVGIKRTYSLYTDRWIDLDVCD